MRTVVLSALLCAAALPAQATAPSHPLAPPGAPQVTVEVTDGVTDAAAGDRLDYRVTVRNLGATALHGARVEQRMPATTESATAPGGRVTADHTAVWHTDIAAHAERRFTASAVLGERADAATAAPGTLRAATTVCVYATASAAPASCSGDADDLPESRPGSAAGQTPWSHWLIGAGLLGAAALLFRGRRGTTGAGRRTTAAEPSTGTART
ncbi:hypothetical protein [Streptomyces pinistramenti]|uniref:hypothetical protein n=1 Tax=Streptomyces pinistramenti TaxID=2884812 RepID=UPI001D0843A0|nr:hypothetical protein [Streptomyces pinistramenti]MCB5908672.1 hypothetical protein [Streptomyces pinistramenti]